MSSIQQFFQSFRHAYGIPPEQLPQQPIHVRSVASLHRRVRRRPLLEELSRGRIRLAVRTALKAGTLHMPLC